ncbi:uncharacterized protein C8Q71DRAFT_279368 [Rhodofomes roseus]|uniref:Uncharacterized protein n=1 Tax=Rhodofomes roseus TaxID=34475 RepID=A0ABQ8K504_9APHY|nr:uncharacterized protein C8Q71DRAFT_279368 [Rhodofomes roseus]KAH9832046.1 hypothetical protein C8Q71DRAFT_279368 [Rhodofomes roseus]
MQSVTHKWGASWLKSTSQLLTMVLSASISAVIAQGIVFFATWHCSFTTMKLARAAGQDAKMTTILLRDGSIHFGALLCVNALQAASPYTEQLRAFQAFPGSLTAVILSRFLLNLRSAANPVEGTNSASMSELNFSGPHSLGGSIVLHKEHDDEEMVEEEFTDGEAAKDTPDGDGQGYTSVRMFEGP